MFKPAEKSELNQISLTGMRAIVLIGLLIEAPRSLQEIREVFISLNIMEPEHSDDILRIDINTLRYMGCEISRADSKSDGKYVLTKHPFALDITEKEIGVLKRAYKKVRSSADIKLVIKFDELFKKFAEHIGDTNMKETILGISILKSLDTKILKDLIEDCEQKRIVKLIYRNPSSKDASEKTVFVQKIVLQNDSVYLYGIDTGKNKSVVLNVKRILSIISRISGGCGIEVKTTNVKFFLKSFGVNEIDEENEQILETLEDGYIVEGRYYNDFLAMQRILSFGANCKVLEPQEIKDEVIQRLKNMRDVYNA